MADIHVIDGSFNSATNRVSKTVVFHFAVPPVDQVAAAAQDPGLVAFVSQVPDITAPELADIQAGTVVEESHEVAFHLSMSPAERLALMRTLYAQREPIVLNAYRARYYEYLSTFTST